VLVADALSELIEVQRNIPVPKVAQTNAVNVHNLRGDHATNEVPDEEAQLHRVAAARLRLPARVERPAQNVYSLPHTAPWPRACLAAALVAAEDSGGQGAASKRLAPRLPTRSTG